MDEMERLPVDLSGVVVERIQRRLMGAPVILVSPIGDQCLQERPVRAVGPGGVGGVGWPTDTPDAPWTYGTDRAFLETLVAYWRDEYDWRAHETALNAFDHYTTEVDGQPLHFVHQRASNSSAVPLLMTHGWPPVGHQQRHG